MRSRLKLWNESGTKRARIADSSRNPIRSPQHLALTAIGAALDQVCTGSTSGGLSVKSLKSGVESEWGKSQGDSAISSSLPSAQLRTGAGTHNHRRSLVGAGGNSESLNPHGRGVWVPAFAGTTAERGSRARPNPQFVFATLGGIAVVTNDVASSIAGPNGVGMVMRKGTRTRVPAIGTKAISIRRSVARYLITGRSGM